ncbi:serine hydrolase [Paraglaciecola sp. L3A3]|uniref:serine hydrolase domain-containing protein n=1 Tax=Paraglaciecola sp. L3A3 TaxID=2686358 RepID=UPI00131DE5C2|nr:serine hydrolase domain-containing protein [Paraglaciecola sp. L3A3]
MTISNKKLQAITTHFQQYVDQGQMVGLTTLVAHQGEIVHFESYGYQNKEHNLVTSADTIYRIYSMTKPIVSTALMMLWQQGRFALTDTVGQYLPEFANPKVFVKQTDNGEVITTDSQPLTILDLLRHTSGLSAGSQDKGVVERLYLTKGVESQANLTKLSQTLGPLPLVAQPGERWIYSLSSDIQGRLIEVLSGQSLEQFLQQQIFKPLGMSDSGFYVPAEKSHRLCEMYAFSQTPPLMPYRGPDLADFLAPPAILSGGTGLVASTKDYWKFAQMLANKGEFNGTRLLQENTVSLMTKNQLPEHIPGIWQEDSGLGYGFSLGVVMDESKIAGHGFEGEFYWEGKANSLFFVDPKSNTVAILMTNIFPYWSLPLLADMRKLVYAALDVKNHQ